MEHLMDAIHLVLLAIGFVLGFTTEKALTHWKNKKSVVRLSHDSR